jgi:hypothetical protein
VRDASEFAAPACAKPDPLMMLDIGSKIIEQQMATSIRGIQGPLRGRPAPGDRAENEGRPVKPWVETEQGSKIVDLMATLDERVGSVRTCAGPRSPVARLPPQLRAHGNLALGIADVTG